MARIEYERGEVQAVLEWMKWQHPDLIIYKIENEGKRHPAFVKKNGILKGMPDLHLAQPSGSFCGLFLEMKRGDGKGKLSNAQKEMGERLIEAGYGWVEAHGFEEAKNYIELYLNPPEE